MLFVHRRFGNTIFPTPLPRSRSGRAASGNVVRSGRGRVALPPTCEITGGVINTRWTQTPRNIACQPRPIRARCFIVIAIRDGVSRLPRKGLQNKRPCSPLLPEKGPGDFDPAIKTGAHCAELINGEQRSRRSTELSWAGIGVEGDIGTTAHMIRTTRCPVNRRV
jgi:hypothetical protein